MLEQEESEQPKDKKVDLPHSDGYVSPLFAELNDIHRSDKNAFIKKRKLLQKAYVNPIQAQFLIKNAANFGLSPSDILSIACCHTAIFIEHLATIKKLTASNLLAVIRHERAASNVLNIDLLQRRISIHNWIELLRQYTNLSNQFLSKVDLNELTSEQIKVLASTNKIITIYILNTPNLIEKLNREQLLVICSVHNDAAITQLILSVSLTKLNKEDFYDLALINESIAFFIAKSEVLRQNITNIQWCTLINLNLELAKFALLHPLWKISDDLTAQDLTSLSRKDKTLAMFIFGRFRFSQPKGFFSYQPKLQISDWKNITIAAGEVGKDIILSEIANNFSVEDLMQIAAANRFTTGVVLTRFAKKFDTEQAQHLKLLANSTNASNTDFFKLEKKEEKPTDSVIIVNSPLTAPVSPII